jgi:hypothetical protein
MLVYIGEIDRRKLYLEHAYPSMFAFCTKRFRMSEAVAARRIRAGRTTCRFPCILGMVRRGELHLSGVHQLAGHLTDGNHQEVLRRARHRSMREIDQLIAEIAPKPDVAAIIRALPEQRMDRAGSTTPRGPMGQALSDGALAESSYERGSDSREGNAGSPTRRQRNLATPLSPRRYKLQVTIGQKARDELAELQNLLSHQIPDGDPAAVVERALEALLAETKKKKGALADKPRGGRKNVAPTDKPRGGRKNVAPTDKPPVRPKKGGGRRKNGGGRTRTIPAHIRREVFRRDEGRCAFVDCEGRRCESAWQVEFHHCVPYGRDGPHSAGNVELRCRAHNQFEAEVEYGREFMAVRRGGA